MKSVSVPAVYMRGGKAKAVFFEGRDLPRNHGERDALLLRLIGSPDTGGRQLDGMGGGTPATSQVVVVSPSRQDECDVDCLVGRVAIDRPEIDWSGGSSELLAAAGPFAIAQALVPAVDGLTRVRIWQPGPGQRVDAFVPVRHGQVLEEGVFVDDELPFPGAEIRLELLAGDAPGQPPLLPTGAAQDLLRLGALGELRATLIDTGEPVAFLRAEALGLSGRELPAELKGKRRLASLVEAIRVQAALAMGLADTAEEAVRLRSGLPVVAWVARPAAYRGSAGNEIAADRVDVLARMMAGGRLHASIADGVSIALAAAAALPGSVVGEVARTLPGVPTRIGHPAGTLTVGAELSRSAAGWRCDKAVLSHGARRLMSGFVHLPSRPGAFGPGATTDLFRL